MRTLRDRIYLLIKTKNKALFFVLLSLGIFFPVIANAIPWYCWLPVPPVMAVCAITGGYSASSGVTSIAYAIVGAFLLTLASIAVTLSNLAAGLLTWVMSDSFTNLSYTNAGLTPIDPGFNNVVATGFSVTQSLANMFLVLVLVYIGIATMLRLAGYETKKLLRNFIIIALIVNFSPVILGVAIDAANILMYYFTSKIGDFNKIAADIDETWNRYKAGFSTGNIAALMQLSATVVISIANFFIMLAFAVIFLARRIVLWILVILAPLAFVFSILPISRIRTYYEKWLNAFIDWTILGIVLSFFLYLGKISVGSISPPEGISSIDVAGSMLATIVPIAFSAIGLLIGLSVGSGIASKVFGATRGGLGWVGAKVWQRGIKPRVEPVVKGALSRVYTGVDKFGQWAGKRWYTRPLAMPRVFLPEVVRKYAETRPTIEKSMTDAKAYSSATIARRILSKDLVNLEATGQLIEFCKTRGDSQDLFNEFKNLHKAKFEKKYGRKIEDKDIFENKELRQEFDAIMEPLLTHANGAGMLGDVLRVAPRLTRVAAGKIGGYKEVITETTKPDGTKEERKRPMTEEEAVFKAVDEARSQHIASWEREELLDKHVVTRFAGKGAQYWNSLLSIKGAQETVLKTLDEIFTDFSNNLIASGKTLDDAGKQEEFKKYCMDKNGGKEGLFQALDYEGFKANGWRLPKFSGIAPSSLAVGLVRPSTESYGEYRTPEEIEKMVKESEEETPPSSGEISAGKPSKKPPKKGASEPGSVGPGKP